MALALIIEDGTNVAGANSYVTVDEVRAYCDLRGDVLPAADDDVIPLIVKGMDYIEGFEEQLSGKRTFGMLQPLSWPRANVSVHGEAVYAKYVPTAIKAVVCYLASIADDVDLVGNRDSNAVTLEKIGPLQTNYSPTQGATVGPMLPQVTRMMKPFLRSGAGMLRSVRI